MVIIIFLGITITLVQASISEIGNSVILIADRLLTSKIGEDVPSYEFEWNKSKILSFKKVGILNFIRIWA